MQKLKERFRIERITRYSAKKLLDNFHYIHTNGGNYRSGINYGLLNSENILCGVCVFHSNSAKEIIKGCFSIDSYKLEGFYELGRLCINPNFFEKNLTSYFLGNSIKLLRKETKVVCLLTYADCHYHVGYIYQACNFKYYGLTDAKKDFFYIDKYGNEKKLQRGKCKHLDGEWRDKAQKHRYLIIYDDSLKTKWVQMDYPKGEQLSAFNNNSSNVPFNYIPFETQQTKLF